jgi:transcriptional antiterminator Rof (Rho-off)/predicted house-cleaning noncanonical NTP pyrophosphatase (MazG superfamily)
MKIAKSEVAELIKEANGSYIEAYKLLLARREAEAVVADRTTVAQRKQQHLNAIQQNDEDRLLELDRKFVTALDRIHENEVVLEPGRMLSHSEALGLMQELLDQRDMTEFLAARLEMIKEAVSVHITAEKELSGVEDPEHQNGSISVPEVGYRFAKERCGRKKSEVNVERLQELLGADEWEEVCDVVEIPRQIIPKHKEYNFSPEKMMKLAQKDPKALSKLLECLEVGGWRTPVITVRPLS